MVGSLTYACYAGKVKLHRLDDGTIVVIEYHRDLARGWHSQKEINRLYYGPDEYDAAKRSALLMYDRVLDRTIRWVKQEISNVNSDN